MDASSRRGMNQLIQKSSAEVPEGVQVGNAGRG